MKNVKGGEGRDVGLDPADLLRVQRLWQIDTTFLEFKKSLSRI